MRRSRRTLLLAVVAMAALLGLAVGWTRPGAAARAPSPTDAAAGDADLLFREALRRGYALDDLIVRRQLVRRMRDTLLQEHPVGEPDDTALSAYLDDHADRYRTPARYSFDHVYLSRGAHGPALQAAAATVAGALQAAPANFDTLGDPFPRGRHLDRLDATQIEADLGHAVAQTVATLPPHRWQGPYASPLGLHFLRVTSVEAPQLPPFAQVRARVRVDYLQARQREVLREALAGLREDFADAPPLPRAAPLADEEMP